MDAPYTGKGSVEHRPDGKVKHHDGFQINEPLFPGQIVQCVQFLRLRRQRLFADHVLALFQQQAALRRMQSCLLYTSRCV